MASLPLHFTSLEHNALERRLGERTGRTVGRVLGGISGWLELALLVGLWLSPQPRFIILPGPSVMISSTGLSIPLVHLALGLTLLTFASWISIRAVVEMGRHVGLDVVDTHSRPGTVVRSGPYSLVRHPQYLGACIAHLGGVVLFSATYALWFTPIYLLVNHLLCWREEKKLLEELGDAYRDYRKQVGMYLPRRRS